MTTSSGVEELPFYLVLLVYGGIIGHMVTRLVQLLRRNRKESRDRALADFERRDDARMERIWRMLGQIAPDDPRRYPSDTLSPYLQRAFEEGRRESGAKLRSDEIDRRLRDIQASLEKITNKLDEGRQNGA